MNTGDISIYPDIFRSGLERIEKNASVGADLLYMLTALEQFQRDIKDHESISDILRVTTEYIGGLNLFKTGGFYLVNSATFEFELVFCAPEQDRARLAALAQDQIDSGKFAWALKQGVPILFESRDYPNPQRGVFHALGDSSHRVGMFCGLLQDNRLSSQEITLRLLSILLSTCSYALAEAQNRTDLTNKVLSANHDLQRTLQENAVLARIPAENPSPVIRVSRNGQVLYRNESGQEVLAQMGCGVGDIVDADWLSIIERLFETGERQEFEVAFDENTIAFVAVSVREAGYANFYGTDVTAREKAEAELVRAKEAAQAANGAKSEFLANMSHEIRTPMNAILGFADLLSKSQLTSRQQSHLQAISSSGKTLLTLINDILDLSKIEAGKLEIQFEPIALRQIINEIQHTFATKAAEKHVDLMVQIDSEFPNSVMLDEVRVRQILFNIVGNALKFTETGYVSIRARTLIVRDTGRADLLLEVEDTGIGIPAKEQKRIFESFSQVSGQSTKKFGGTGLGLAITKRLAEMMGGKVALTSEVGKGSTFSVLFPEVEISRETKSAEEIAAFPLSAFVPSTILVADDAEMNRELVAGYFEGSGHRLIFATNGREAVDLARSQKPDLVLMDIRMPVMDGYDATVEIKSIPSYREIPVLAVTASTLKEGEARVRSICDGFIRKPFSQNDLSLEVQRFLKLKAEAVEGTPAVDLRDPGTEIVMRERWPELAELLAREQTEIWPSLCQSLTVRRISQFACRLQQWGSEYGAPVVRRYGQILEQQSQEFDLDHLPKTLAKFPEVITRIRNA